VSATLEKELQLDAGLLGGASRSAGSRRRIRKLSVQLGSLAVFFSLWQIAGATTDPVLFATPTRVVAAFADLVQSGILHEALIVALKDLGMGLGLAIVVGLTVGIAMGRSLDVENALNPYVNFMQATPVIALVPLLIIWFGIDTKTRVAVVFIFSVWAIIISTQAGVKGTPRALMDVARVYHLSEWRIIREITLPNAVPVIWAGLRIALGKALIGMVVAELLVSIVGIGKLVSDYGQTFQTDYLLAAILSTSLVGVFAAGLLHWSLARFFPWVAATSASRE
jgi:ABC-type nitrate/sulfonate/bicarbonate transport system permease component